jgi:hypothetical protein
MHPTDIARCPECDAECFIYDDHGSAAVCYKCGGDGAVRCGYCDMQLTVAEAARVDRPAVHSPGPICDGCVAIDEQGASEVCWYRWHFEALPPVPFWVQS